MIVNPKTLDPRDPDSPPVLQIETAMGSAISLVEGAAAVNVARSRFLPVKTCNDLLAVRSDCFVYSEREGLKVNPARTAGGRSETIKIRLDPACYGTFDRMEQRFPEGEPSLVGCDALAVEGDVRFGKGVVIQGSVTITGKDGTPGFIPSGARIDGDIRLE